MAEVILMPRLSDTMTEGVIAAWHKKVGDSVKKGDLLAEVETDKATMDLESYKDGTLLYTGTDKGGKIQVNDPDRGVWKYSWDALGRVRTQQDSRGVMLGYEYDGAGRMIRRSMRRATDSVYSLSKRSGSTTMGRSAR